MVLPTGTLFAVSIYLYVTVPHNVVIPEESLVAIFASKCVLGVVRVGKVDMKAFRISLSLLQHLTSRPQCKSTHVGTKRIIVLKGLQFPSSIIPVEHSPHFGHRIKESIELAIRMKGVLVRLTVPCLPHELRAGGLPL